MGETLDNMFYVMTNTLAEPCFTGGWGKPKLLQFVRSGCVRCTDSFSIEISLICLAMRNNLIITRLVKRLLLPISMLPCLVKLLVVKKYSISM